MLTIYIEVLIKQRIESLFSEHDGWIYIEWIFC